MRCVQFSDTARHGDHADDNRKGHDGAQYDCERDCVFATDGFYDRVLQREYQCPAAECGNAEQIVAGGESRHLVHIDELQVGEHCINGIRACIST